MSGVAWSGGWEGLVLVRAKAAWGHRCSCMSSSCRWLQPKCLSLYTSAESESRRQSFGWRRREELISLSGKGGHSRLRPSRTASSSKGFNWVKLTVIAQNRVLDKNRGKSSVCILLMEHFKAIKAGVRRFGDGCWWSLKLWYSDLLFCNEECLQRRGVLKRGKTPGTWCSCN